VSTTTPIEWTDRTWNPVRGCARVSPGCEHCYAERVAHRFGGKGQPYEGLTVLGKHGPRWAGRARFVPEMLGEPLRWRKPQRVFVNSMSDLFHEDIADEEIAAVFGVMAACPLHTFQVLTKRPARMAEWFEWVGDDPHMQLAGQADQVMNSLLAGRLYKHFDDEMGETDLPWPLPNVWLGVSCEDQQRADERIPLLLQCPAAVRFVSAEPLLGTIDFLRVQWPGRHKVDVLRGGGWFDGPFTLRQPGDSFVNHSDMATINWVIVGGESGPGVRPCHVDWIRDIVGQCKVAGVSCFVKQFGSALYRSPPTYLDLDGLARGALRDRKGGDPREWPSDLRVREFPAALELGEHRR